MTMFSLILAVSVFAISFPLSATMAVAQEESGKVTLFPPESLSTPELDISAAEEVQDVKLPPLVISATRYEMPQDQVSSDITVITKEEIAHLPVHDLSEALNYITGLDISRTGGPGTSVTPYIQGSEYRHVKVLIDGIPIESLSGGLADLSVWPMDNLERVEILKGSASSVWGAALGGVINVITRKPADKLTAEGGVSVGENSTRRYNAGLSGKVNNTGYILTASRFETDGFFKFQNAISDNVYGKLTEDMGKGLKAEASYAYAVTRRALYGDDSIAYREDEEFQEHRGRLMMTYLPKDDLELSVSIYDRVMEDKFIENYPYMFAPDNTGLDKESLYGGTFNTVWRHSKDSAFSIGAEASHGELTLRYFGNYDLNNDKRAVFANESYGLGDLTINIGARYDNDNAYGSEVSPSAGVVYKIGGDTFLRVNAARGFSPPPLTYKYNAIQPNDDLHAERAWTYQAGIESASIPGLWGKLTFFKADISEGVDSIFDTADVNGNGITWETLKNINIKSMRRQGFEVDLKTKEYKGLSVSYGYAFTDVVNLDTDKIVDGQARETHNVGADYMGPFETRTTVNGHYVWWHTSNSSTAKDATFIWDAKLSKYLAQWSSVVGEAFVAVHNFTNERQYWDEAYPNPGRWVEAGISLTSF